MQRRSQPRDCGEDRAEWTPYLRPTGAVRMKFVRTILVIFLCAGLALAPNQAASAMRTAPMLPTHDAAAYASAPHQACSCCDVAVRCTMRACATRCVQLAPALDFAISVALAGHAHLRAFVLLMHEGLNWQPPTPPRELDASRVKNCGQ
jgi:hypothetical protein